MNYKELQEKAHQAFLASFKASNGAYKNLSWLSRNKREEVTLNDKEGRFVFRNAPEWIKK